MLAQHAALARSMMNGQDGSEINMAPFIRPGQATN